MKEIFERIWELALPYQDKRDDAGHAEVTLSYARRLVELEDGDEDIVIPAIILHDIGYSQIPRERRMLIFDRNAAREERDAVRYEHQEESVKLAKDILNKVGYPPDLMGEILDIISEHDTREGFISKNEGLVRDADKLWRFSRAGFDADEARQVTSNESRCKRLEARLKDPNYIYSQSARHIALKELEQRKNLN